MSARTRSCPSCYAIHPAAVKVCNAVSPDSQSACGYEWPVRSRKAPRGERVARSIASRSPVVSITDLPPGAHLLEGDFQEPLKRALNQAGRATRVWRQNVGTVQLRDRTGKRTHQFSAGPKPGAADLSGIAKVSIGGKSLGVRLEIEVKVLHEWTDDQKNFALAIEGLGGIYVLVKYDKSLTLAANVSAGVAKVDDAIAKALV